MNIEELHETASKALIDGNSEKAEQCYLKILEEVPNDEAAITSLMDIYQDTDKVKYYLTRANYNIVNGKAEYGINDCKKALAHDAENIEAREKLARLYRATNKPLKAIDEFSRLIEIHPDYLLAYVELIDLYTSEKALDSAIETAIKANEKFGDTTNFYDVLGKLYFDNGDYENALKVTKDSFLKAKILLQTEKNEEARELLNKLSAIQGRKEETAMYNLLEAQYCYNTKNFDKAFEYIDKYSSIMGPNPISFQMRALCFEEKGDEFMAAYNWAFMNKAANKPDEALVEFTHAYSINPNNKDVLIELAKLYELNKEKYTAMDWWQKVYDLDGDETARAILYDFYVKEGDSAMAQRYMTEEEVQQKQAEDDIPEVEDEGLLNKILNLFSKK